MAGWKAAAPVVFLTSAIVFLLMRVLPGEPIMVTLRTAQTDVGTQTIAQLRHEAGLDRPVYVQYAVWVTSVLRGNLGRSCRVASPSGT